MMLLVMELPSAKQRAQKMMLGAVRGDLEEERELFEAACPAK